MSILSKLTGIHIKIPGVSQIGDAIYNTAKSTIPGLSAVDTGLNAVANLVGGSGGVSKIPGVGGLLQGALSNPLETAGIVSSALDQSKARGLETEALNSLRSAYDSKAGLRTKGVAGLMNPTAPDMSGVDYGSSGSVYGKARGVKRIQGVA